MGIPGLTSYAKKNVPAERVNLTARAVELEQTITLAVDVSALAYHLGSGRHASFHTGGCYSELAQATIKFVTDLRVRRIELRGIVDGLSSNQKSLTTLARLYDSLQDKKEVMRQFTTYGRKAGVFQGRGPFVKPPLMHETVLSALKQCGVPLIRAQREADDLLAHSARPDGGSCHAVLSNDSDFLVYDTGPLIMFGDINIVDPCDEYPLGYMVARMYTRDRVARSLGVPSSLMPVVASLVGTDSTPPKQEIHHRLSAMNKTKSKKSYNKTDVVIQAARYVRDFTKAHSKIVPDASTNYDVALASSLFGTVLEKSKGKRSGGGKAAVKKKKAAAAAAAAAAASSSSSPSSTTGRSPGGGDKSRGGQTLVEYLHEGRTRYGMEMTMEEWNGRLAPKHWSSFHNCEHDRHLTEILVDRNFTWGRPPLESVDSYMLCLPIRQRLYTHLYGTVLLSNNPNEGSSNSSVDEDGDAEMITNKESLMSALTSFAAGMGSSATKLDAASSSSVSIVSPVTENRRVAKKKKSKPALVLIGEKTKQMTLDDVLYSDGSFSSPFATTSATTSANLWSPSKAKHQGTLPTIICRVLHSVVRHDSTLQSKLNTSVDDPLMRHLHRMMTKGDKPTMKKVLKNPNNLNYLERLTVYTLCQVIYVHVRMVLQAFGENLLFGPFATSPQGLFAHFPKWVQGSEEIEAAQEATGKIKKRKNEHQGWEWRLVEKKTSNDDDPMEVEDM